MLFTLLQEVSQEMWGDNVNMMLDGNLTVAPIVGDCSIAWGFAEAGLFWTGQNPLRVDDVGVVCAGPFASLAKSTAAAATAAAAAAAGAVLQSECHGPRKTMKLIYKSLRTFPTCSTRGPRLPHLLDCTIFTAPHYRHLKIKQLSCVRSIT